MARIRTIKPDFWTDEKVTSLSFGARLLFIGLWNFADDDGRMKFHPRKLHLQILPADADANINRMISDLSHIKLIQVYTVDGKDYLQITNFGVHQKIDRRSKSRHPAPPVVKNDAQQSEKREDYQCFNADSKFDSNSRQIPPTEKDREKEKESISLKLGHLTEGRDSDADGIREEKKPLPRDQERSNHHRHADGLLEPKSKNPCETANVDSQNGKPMDESLIPKSEDRATRRDSAASDFNEWWSANPRKVAKKQAMLAYKRARKVATKEQILEGIRAFADASAGKELRFLPHPTTWLNHERWNDVLTPQTALVEPARPESKGLEDKASEQTRFKSELRTFIRSGGSRSNWTCEPGQIPANLEAAKIQYLGFLNGHGWPGNLGEPPKSMAA